MTHAVRVRATAEKAIARLDPKVRARVYEVLHELEANPRPDGCKKMKGRFNGHYRVKVAWGWVILYVVDDAKKSIEVVEVDTRGDAY